MNRIKDFLIPHGEKAGLAIVAIMALWSISGNLFSDKRVLSLPDGTEQAIDRDAIKQAETRLRDHVNDPNKSQNGDGVQRVSQMVDEAWLQWKRPVKTDDLDKDYTDDVSLNWFCYVQPPMPLLLTKLIKVKLPERVEDVDNEYISRGGAPVGLTVVAGGKRTVILCSDSGAVNHVDPANVQVLLFRKEIGEAREDLKTEVRVEHQTWPRGGLKNVQSSMPEDNVSVPTMPEQPMMDDPMGMDFDPVTGEPIPHKKKKTVKPTSYSAKGKTPAAAGGVDFSGLNDLFGNKEESPVRAEEDDGTAYRESIKEAQEQALEDVKTLCDPTLLVKGGWEIISPNGMVALSEELSSGDDLAKILETGKIPGQDEKEADKKDVDAKDAASAPKENEEKSVWEEMMKSTNVRSGSDESVENAESEGGALLRTYRRRQYVFVDNNVTENKVYRYRVVLRFKAELPPKEVLEAHPGWALRAEVLGMGPAYLGLPERKFGEIMKKEGATQFVGPFGQWLYPEMKRVERDPELNYVLGLRGADGTLTQLGFDMHKPVYTDFVYSGVVVTPLTRQISLQNASLMPDPLCTVRVAIADDKGDIQERSFAVSLKDKPRPDIKWHYWLRYDDKKKVIWPQPVLNRDDMLFDVYEKHLPSGFVPVEIGELDELRKPAVDFRTGWGVVDMRPYKVIRKSYKYNSNTEEWTPLTPLTQDRVALVLRQIKADEGRPAQYKRVIRKESDPYEGKEGYKTEFEYVWEPELQEKILERKANETNPKEK